LQNLIDQSPQTDTPKWQKLIIFSMIAIAVLTLWAILYAPIYDGDIWFHMLYGKQILENKTLIPDHTIYSWTPSSNENIYCAWTGQILYYLLYKYFGNGGIITLRYLAASSLFIAILLLSRQRNTFYNPLTWCTALLSTLAIGQATLDKPEILSFMFMALIVWNWYTIKLLKQNVVCQIYLFPLLILVWVNTHGLFTFGCLFLLCVGLGETINQFFYQQNALPRKLYYHLLLALFLSAGCTLITPYGYDYIHQLIMQYFDQQLQSDVSHVLAYTSTFELTNSPQLFVFADVAIGLILLVFTISLRKKQLDFVPIISNLLFAFLFTRYGRLVLPWIAVFSLSIVYYGSAVSVIRMRRKVLFITTLALITFVLSGWFLHQEKQSPSRGQWLEFGVSEQFTLDEEIDFIQKNYKNARLGNMYSHGAYILWKLWPQTKVMMDARYFPYKSWCNEYFDFRNGVNIEMFIKKYPFDVIAIQHIDSMLIPWFYKSKEWKLVFYGKSAVIFARSSLTLPGRIMRGESLNNINAFFIATNVFNTSIVIRDWPGADIILSTMKRSFTDQRQQKIISALAYIKSAAQMYEQKDYSASIGFMEQAVAKQRVDHKLYAAALLMKAIEDWQGKQWNVAIQNTINSVRVQDSFAANYNLALMLWLMETKGQSKQSQEFSLTNQNKEVNSKWRKIFITLIQNKNQYPQYYAQFIENANKILNGDQYFKTQLIESDY
jgi:hypothetical protein